MSDVHPLRLDLDEIDRRDPAPDGYLARSPEPDCVPPSGAAENAMRLDADDPDEASLEEAWPDAYPAISRPALWPEWMAGILGASPRHDGGINRE